MQILSSYRGDPHRPKKNEHDSNREKSNSVLHPNCMRQEKIKVGIVSEFDAVLLKWVCQYCTKFLSVAPKTGPGLLTRQFNSKIFFAVKHHVEYVTGKLNSVPDLRKGRNWALGPSAITLECKMQNIFILYKVENPDIAPIHTSYYTFIIIHRKSQKHSILYT